MSVSNLNTIRLGTAALPSFTVVTPNYNMGSYLASTIESVLRNLGPDDEYLIIDGGSTDSSLDVIRSYESRLSGWVSEPDVGYADAVAKGFRRARGQYLCWVNSGDLLLEGALDNAKKALERTGADLIFGDDLLIDEDGKILQVTNGHASDLRKMMLFGGWTPLQESCFWTSAIYEKIGGIDPKIKYAADFDLFLRMSQSGYSCYVENIFGAFRRHTGQISIEKSKIYRAEREMCRARDLKNSPDNLFTTLINIYYWFKVRIRVRLYAKKGNMNHMNGRLASDIISQASKDK
jgi:glycosyltransferase involved in cell wall biosynthesis